MVCSPSNCPTLAPAAVTDLAHRVHVDGREQVLEHGGHELDVHALGAEAVEHQEGRVVKLLLVHPVSAQGRDHVPYQCILADLERQSGASWEPHQLLPKKGWVRVQGSGWRVGREKGKPCSFTSERLL